MKYLPKAVHVCLFLLLLSTGITVNAQQKDILKFAVVTDTHIGKQGNNTGLKAIVNDINKNPEVDFVLHAGDISDFGYDEELGEAKALMDGLSKPYFIVPGNHDTGWSGSGGLIYDKLWKEQKFVKDINGVRFIGFSTGPYGRMSRGYVPLDQMRWLDSLIQVTPKQQPVIFISHYSLDEGLSNYNQVIDKLHRVNTLAVLCGHGHINKLFDYNGIRGIMTRTAQIRQGTLAYNVFSLTPDTLHVTMVEVGQPANQAWATLPMPPKKNKSTTKLSENNASVIDPQFTNVQAVWTYQDEGNIVAAPAVWKNSVLIGNLLGEFKSLDAANAKVNWRFKTGKSIHSSAEIAGNRVVFASADSNIYCLNAKNGKLIWKVKTMAPALASPTIERGVVYIGSSDLKFRAIDLKTGKVTWSFEGLAGFPPSKPAVADGKVVFGTWNKTLYALNTKDGSLAWQWRNDEKSHYYSPAMSIPVIQNGKVYMVAPDEKLREYNLGTGEQTFVTDQFRVRESLGGNAERNLLVAKTMQDTIVAWSTQGREPEPIMNISGGYGRDFSFSAPVFSGSTFYFGTTFGRVYAIDMEGKNIEWIYELSEDMINTVKPLADGSVVATSVDGKIVLLQAREKIGKLN
ncbi:outer membrane protein assembly factor BamB family protein [Pontibacter harenae]|uniref:outer membrane protein assembly factor BamB family protein n=1 Tax=Pontibacter harenae TaxID=2894083 RepID=UPI001E53FD7F|nr:PQQ-binding-like beta-propeller repeat protein [Pontibacter harenae]MCC9168432.1 PQQ-binding-like beta-propeller repeat protein [Pontibacter harenae]